MKWFALFGMLLFLGVTAAPCTMTKSSEGKQKCDNDIGTTNKKILHQNPLFKPPLLTILILITTYIRYFRGALLLNISADITFQYPYFSEFNITHPLIFLRAFWLILTSYLWLEFWMEKYEAFGWNPIF